MANSILKLHNVCKYYRRSNRIFKILNHVNIDILENTFTAIVGPSGSGKSTLLHIMGALERPSEGNVIFEGQELGELKDRDLSIIRRRSIGFVFQFFNLLPELSTWQNIAIPLLIDGILPSEARRVARNLGKKFFLTHCLDLPTGLLSGGELQRTAIARAMVHDPRLILADEPTGNLDQANGQIIVKLLRELVTNERRTVVMVTHNLNITTYADSLIDLIDGQIANNPTF